MSTTETSSPEWTGNKWFPSEIRWMRRETMARKMGVTVRTIRNMVRRGQLERRRENGKVWVRICTFEEAPQTETAPAKAQGVQAIRRQNTSESTRNMRAPEASEPASAPGDHGALPEIIKEMQNELANLRSQAQDLNEKLFQVSLAKERTDLIAGSLHRTVADQERALCAQKEQIQKMDARIAVEAEASEMLQTACELESEPMTSADATKIFILTDYVGVFYSRKGNHRISMDLPSLKENLESLGFQVEILEIAAVNFNPDRFKNEFVIYQSSDDAELLYKSYIEDVILGLAAIGARIIPRYEYLRAHHNKVFMEILRSNSELEEIKTIKSQTFGTLEELKHFDMEFPVVVKPAWGASSRGVTSANSMMELKAKVRKLSQNYIPIDVAKDLVKLVVRKGHLLKSHHRRKYIVQNMIPDLDHDFKILVYDKKYYVLKREIRDNDFRSSGSGKFSYIKNISDDVFEFSKRVYEHFDVPFISLDVAYKDGVCHLIEFQFVVFGTITLENSPFYFQHMENGWECVEGTSVLEEEFARSLASSIRAKIPSS